MESPPSLPPFPAPPSPKAALLLLEKFKFALSAEKSQTGAGSFQLDPHSIHINLTIWDLLKTMVVSEGLIRSEKLLLQMMEKSGWAFILDIGITYITYQITTGKVKLGDFKLLGLL